MFFLGLLTNYIKSNSETFEKIDFDYSEQDSLFAAIKENTKNLVEKSVDSDSELLDFRTDEIESGTKSIPELAEKSININSAQKNELMSLPGIGETTAQRIIEYRNTKGFFSSVEDIMKVKGIGEKKFGRFKKYIFIEK